MNIKKILAREFIATVVSTIICGIAFSIGYYLDTTRTEKLDYYHNELNNYISNFRKSSKVDSLYKLQMKFYTSYNTLFHSQKGNYFFWIDVRNSISDSTFNFTYANDEIIKRIRFYGGINDINRNAIVDILGNQYKKRNAVDWSSEFYNDSVLKNEFKIFSLTNKYETFLPQKSWNDYQKLRQDAYELQLEHANLQDQYLEYAMLFCFISIFCLRYIYYLIKWSILNL